MTFKVLAPLALAVVLVACSDDSDSSSGASGAPTPTPDLEEQMQNWASAVCASSDALADQVTGIADGLNVDLSSGLDQLPAIEEQVSANIADVQSGIDDVQQALAAVPDDSPEAQAFASEMDELISDARVSGQKAVTLLGEAGAADNVLTGGLAAAAAVAEAQSAYDDATSALELLDRTRNEKVGEVGVAFASAPDCQ